VFCRRHNEEHQQQQQQQYGTVQWNIDRDGWKDEEGKETPGGNAGEEVDRSV